MGSILLDHCSMKQGRKPTVSVVRGLIHLCGKEEPSSFSRHFLKNLGTFLPNIDGEAFGESKVMNTLMNTLTLQTPEQW